MASNTETFTTEIYVNQDQANAAMGKLEAQVQKTAKAYEKLLNQKDADPAKTEKAKQAWEQARATLASAERGVEEYGKALKNLSGQSMDRLLKMQKQINAELKKTKPNTEEWKKLSKEYGQVTNRIRDLKKEQEGLINQKGRFASFFEKVGQAGNKFGLALMAIPNAAKAVVGALKGVIDVTKQVVNASQTMGDKWRNGMDTMKTATDAFFMALSSGDWSAFSNGLTEALKKARELAELKDLLGSFQIAGGYMQAKYRTDYTQQMADATNTENDAETRRKALEQAEADLTAQREFTEREAKATFDALQKMFEAWKGITFDSQEEFDSFFDELFRNVTTGGSDAFNEAKSYINGLVAEMTELKTEGDLIYQDYTESEAMTIALEKATEKYGKMMVQLYQASELNDEKHKELIQTYAQWRGDLQRIEQDTKSFNRTRDRVNKQLDETDTKVKRNTKSVDHYSEAIKRIDKAEAAQINTVKQLYAAGLMDKTTYEAQKSAIEEDYLKQRLATAQQYGRDVDRYMSMLLDRQIARIEYAKALLREEQEEMARYAAQLEAEQDRWAEVRTPQQNQASEEWWNWIGKRAAEIRAEITNESAKQEYETRVRWAQRLAEEEMLTNEEAQKYILKAKIDYAQAAAVQLSNIQQGVSDFAGKLQEFESARLEAQYQKDLTMAGDNAEKREEIDAEYEKKQLELKKKYADTEMVINIAKTTASGAQAIMKAYAELGPVMGSIAAGIIAANTALEIGIIIAQRNAIKNSSVNSGGSAGASVSTGNRVISGYSTGGYTDSAASDHKAVGIVHANEWVAPAWMVRSNPVTFANLESYRKSGSHGRSGSAAKGFADGGYTGQQGGVEIYPADVEALVYAAISRAMADGTIRANVVYQDLKSKENQLGRFNSQTSR